MSPFGWSIVWIVLFLLLSGILHGAEAAMTALPDNELEKESERSRRMKLIAGLLEKPGRFTGGFECCYFLCAAAAGGLLLKGVLPSLTGLTVRGIPVTPLPAGVLLFIPLGFLYFLTACIGRDIGTHHARAVSVLTAGTVRILFWLTGWLVIAADFCGHGFCRLLRIDPAEDAELVTEEEIRLMVDAGEERGVIDENERMMIENVFAFDDRTVADVMTHRTDIAAVEADATLAQLLDFASAEKYSRFPVYRETLDNIVGTVHIKDLMPYIRNGGAGFKVARVMQPPVFVPESKKADDLFRELKHSKKVMAIVLDEYGGTAGLCTMEDLTESIVGAIFDEYDQEESEPIQKQGEDWLMDGTVTLEDAANAIELDISEDEEVADCDTLGGLIFMLLGRIPEPGEKPEVEYRGFRFAVTELSGRRILQVRVSRLPEPEEEK